MPVSFRATSRLKKKLDNSAKGNGRSQAQEAELRLEESFRQQTLLPQVLTLAYGQSLAGMLMFVGRVMKEDGREAAFQKHGTIEAAGNWVDDPHGFDQAVKAVATALESMRPEGEIEPPEVNLPKQGDIGGIFGQILAQGTILAIKGESVSAREEEETAPIAELLGKNITDRMAAPDGRKKIVQED